MRKHALLFTVAFLLLSISSVVHAQRKVKYEAERQGSSEVHIRFPGNNLSYLLGQGPVLGRFPPTPQTLADLLNGAKSFEGQKVGGIKSARVTQIPKDSGDWHIIIEADEDITRDYDFESLMRITWIKAIEKLMSPDVRLTLADKSKNWWFAGSAAKS